MPKIQWSGLPPALRDHLFERLRGRKISAEDLCQLKAWSESEPEAPEGPWYKDFGSFKICCEGQLPKTFLLRGLPVHVRLAVLRSCCMAQVHRRACIFST
ncbi:MAG: hypothetical protein WD118_02450 [Phycisphaeraceae bacterium]